MSSEEDHPRIQDPGEFNQRRRLKEINDAQSWVREVYSTIELDQYNQVQNPPLAIFDAVRAYATQIQWLIVEHGDEKYFKQKLGEIVFPIPNDLKKLIGERRVVGINKVEPHRHDVTGILPSNATDGTAFLNLPKRPAHAYEYNIDIPHKGPEERQFMSEVGVPIDISWTAYQMCNQFVHEAGLDARIEDEIDRDPNPY